MKELLVVEWDEEVVEVKDEVEDEVEVEDEEEEEERTYWEKPGSSTWQLLREDEDVPSRTKTIEVPS